MRYWRKFPAATRFYLVILSGLALLLAGLVFIRLEGLPIGMQIGQALVPDQPTATPTTQGGDAADAALASLPPGAPFLRAVTRAAVRTGPDASFGAPALLEIGQIAPVIGVSPDGLWWAIQAQSYAGGKGWVAAADVVVENPGNAPVDVSQSTRPVATDLLPVAQAIVTVFIRSAPSLEGNKLGSLEGGQSAELLGKSEDGFWYAIRLPEAREGFGWVARDYVVTRNADDPPVVTVAPVGIGGEGTLDTSKPFVVAAWQVNVRAGPGKEYAVVGSLNQGMGAELVGRSQDGLWWAITWNTAESGRGWVASEFVQASNTDNVPVLR